MTAVFPEPTVIGVLSDTHGLLRPQVLASLEGCHAILHAGDVGNQEVLTSLEALAPVFAVRGNMDRGQWAGKLPVTETVEINGWLFFLVHRLEDMDLRPSGLVHAVVFGHSHSPEVFRRDGVLHFNPGSAGPRRFRLPVTMGRITIARGRMEAQVLPLQE